MSNWIQFDELQISKSAATCINGILMEFRGEKLFSQVESPLIILFHFTKKL